MKVILLLVILLLSHNSLANHKIKVMALFTDKAMVIIDGKQRLLKKGKPYHGVTLISSNSDRLVVELHGKQKTLRLGSHIATSFKKPDPGKELIIWRDENGMFRTVGNINGSMVNLLVDTGATSIALSSKAAKRMGIKYKKGKPMHASTASGIAKGYHLTLDRVKIKHIVIYNVDAIVLEGSFPTEVLLGQTFLNRVHMVRDGDKMKLRKKF
jgi:aspartyl protease family protein